MPDKVDNNVVVSLSYKLSLEDGTQVEETDADEPLTYLHGYGSIIPGLENELEGMAVGETKEIVVAPEDAYGEHDPDAVDTISREELPQEIEPEVGMLLTLEDHDGNRYIAQIEEVDDDSITLDFNHPMAGKRLHFDVTITKLREASEEEIAHGHAHDGGHHH